MSLVISEMPMHNSFSVSHRALYHDGDRDTPTAPVTLGHKDVKSHVPVYGCGLAISVES